MSGGNADRGADRGLQNERTALAWQRTVLSGMACALIAARLLALASWPAALTTGVAAVACSAALAAMGRERFRSNSRALAAHTALADARAPLLLTLLVVLTGLSAAVFVLGGPGRS